MTQLYFKLTVIRFELSQNKFSTFAIEYCTPLFAKVVSKFRSRMTVAKNMHDDNVSPSHCFIIVVFLLL